VRRREKQYKIRSFFQNITQKLSSILNGTHHIPLN